MSRVQAGLVLLAVVALLYVLMWWGWRKRARKHELPPLHPVPEMAGAQLRAGQGRYFGSTVSGDWLDRVVAQSLGNRSDCTLKLTADGLEVARPRLGAFHIPKNQLRGVRTETGIAGKVIPPHGVLVVTWQHGDLVLDSGFKLDAGDHDGWVEALNLVKEKQS